MSLIHQYDIRLESYSDAASVTSLTDQAGTNNLAQVGSETLPTYNAANDWMVFTGATPTAIGDDSIPAALNTVMQSNAWTIAILFEQASLAADFLFSFGYSLDSIPGIAIRTDGSGNIISFLRGDDNDNYSATYGSTISVDTEYVVTFRRDATNSYITIDNGTEASVNVTGSDIATTTYDQLALGVYARNTFSNGWSGFVKELRIYDTDESANLGTIVSEMKAGSGGSSIAPLAVHHLNQMRQ